MIILVTEALTKTFALICILLSSLSQWKDGATVKASPFAAEVSEILFYKQMLLRETGVIPPEDVVLKKAML